MLNSYELQVESGSANEAAPGRDSAKLANPSLIAPLWHPEGCTGMSGLYAIINALRLALADRHVFNGPELHALLAAGLRFMSGRLSPEQATLCGLRVTLWRALAEAMAEVARRRTGLWLRVERLHPADHSLGTAFGVVEQAVRELRVPMMLCRGGRYTVVRGFTPSSLLLFDSCGACWLSKRVCGVPADCPAARHVIHPASLLAVSV